MEAFQRATTTNVFYVVDCHFLFTSNIEWLKFGGFATHVEDILDELLHFGPNVILYMRSWQPRDEFFACESDNFSPSFGQNARLPIKISIAIRLSPTNQILGNVVENWAFSIGIRDL